MTVSRVRSPQEALDEVERELNIRIRCFDNWIAAGKVSKTDAQDRLDRMATAQSLLAKMVQEPVAKALTL